jgi:hypothetical protein
MIKYDVLLLFELLKNDTKLLENNKLLQIVKIDFR